MFTMYKGINDLDLCIFVSIKMVKITQLFASFVQISISSN